jgi:hypothetical protein
VELYEVESEMKHEHIVRVRRQVMKAVVATHKVKAEGTNSSSSRLACGDHDSMKRHESVAVFSAEFKYAITVIVVGAPSDDHFTTKRSRVTLDKPA